jgi:hypothetical protein
MTKRSNPLGLHVAPLIPLDIGDRDPLSINTQPGRVSRRLKPGATLKSERLPSSQKLFVRIPTAWLSILERDGGFPAWVRLYLRLWLRSSEGSEPVRLANSLAREAGLDRHSKSDRLELLELRGHVSVERKGRRAPIVTVRSLPGVVTFRGRADISSGGKHRRRKVDDDPSC